MNQKSKTTKTKGGQQPPAVIKELSELIESLDTETLKELHTVIDNQLIERYDDTFVATSYEQLRVRFTPRFAMTQVEALRPWKLVSKVKQQAYKKAYVKAIQYFTKLGFKHNENLHTLVRQLILTSPLFKEKLLFDLIVESLDKIGNLFDGQFPRYRESGGIKILIGALSGE